MLRQRGSPVYPVLSRFSPLLLLAAWEAASRAGLLDQRFFSAPSRIAASFGELLASGELVLNCAVSLWRIAAGFLLGAVPGVAVGLTMGLFPVVRAFLEPSMAAVFPIPKLAILPLILLIFGIGEASKIVIIAIGVFFLVMFNSMAGVVNIDRIYLDVARNHGAGRKDFYFTVALPGALPMVFTGFKLGMGTALLLIVAAEFVGARSGVGFMIWESWDMFDIERMFAGLITVSGIGYVTSACLDRLERLVIPWKA
ncbi:MAG: ABC transporter permease [Firmicutes bacterium]|nr:ABC transporter permease [Bacillota bacterium]